MNTKHLAHLGQAVGLQYGGKTVLNDVDENQKST